MYFIFRDFQFSLIYIPGPSVCIYYFSRFLVISLFFVAGGCFLFSMIFFFSYIPRPTVDISKFSTFFSFPLAYFFILKCVFLFSVIFSFLALYSRSFSVHFLFFTLFSDFIIFRRWRMFSFSMIFSFSCHIPRPTVDISKFSTFFSFLLGLLFHGPKVCIYFPSIFSVSRLYSRSFSVHFHFSRF